MEELFLSSAQGDSSLALPAEPARRSATKVGPKERSVRVQQQVQLTMARRARKSSANGGFHLQKSRAKSFDDTETLLQTAKGSDLGIVNLSFSSSQVRKPSRRVEVSPPVTPGFACFSGTPLQWTYTHPGLHWSHRSAALSHDSFHSDSFRRCAFPEATVRSPVSPRPSESFHGRSPQFSNSVQQSAKSGSQRSFRQERIAAQGQTGEVRLGAVCPDRSPAWSAQVRRERRDLRTTALRQASFPGVETDGWTPLEEPSVHQLHTQEVPPRKSENKLPEMTVERAVSLLSNGDEDTLLRAAGHIQTCCFRSADTKKTVYFLRGIEKLVRLLRSDSESVQRVAAGALRNVVYQSGENKMEVKEKGGLGAILQALRSSRDVETRRELTGLLWNLSSHDLLKEPLSAEVVSVLTKSVLVPTSGISEGENPKDDLLADDVAFHNATGCLRNLSSAGPDSRKAMKECEDLIDSLVYYVRGAIADYKTDDGSTENCVCILHNLSYRLEDELPETNVRVLRESRQNLANRPRAVGCFAHRGTKITEHVEEQCPLLEEKSNPQGTEWLWSTITVRMYLSLLARSVRHRTQEAALGALQNITAGNGPLSEALAFSVVQRENGLQQVRKMLEDGEGDVKRTAVALVKNTCRFQELHPVIVKQVLPELVWMLPGDDGPADATAVSVCLILNHLSLSDRQHVGAIVKEGALPRIVGISRRDCRNGPSRAGQAARVLLHTMWKYSDLHGTYRKFGFRKADFIHTRNTKIVCT
ncbi:plakophilin-2 [Takifugu rubripes]|uniref:Plakophilin 2 n=1 Tax=Takifugu rubripes TaxID=31033 RepID=H2UZJ6_TAKRU|nr:plakophilin-2 [Takifugu rubripes]